MEELPPETAAAAPASPEEPPPRDPVNGTPPPDLETGGPAEEEPLQLQRRTRYKPQAEAPSSPSESVGSVIVLLTALYAQLKGDEGRAPFVSALPESGRKVLQEKRLSRSGVSADPVVRSGLVGDPVAPTAPAEPGILPESGWMGDQETLAGFTTRPSSLPAVKLPAVAPAPPTERPSGWARERLLPILLGLALVELAVAGYLGWHASAPPAPRSPVPAAHRTSGAAADPQPDEVSDAALAVARAAVDATDKGDLVQAFKLLNQAQQDHVALPGLSYQAALLAYNLGSVEKLEEWTDRSIAAHELVPECWYLRANSEAARADFNTALASLESAARFAPFSPRYEFFWGEFLRRVGTPALALPRFDQALRCRPSSLDTELILFKQRLARIELGNDSSFQAELAAQLDREDASGETWLLAAANEITRAAFPAAAEDLRRAARLLPPALLRSRLHDYVFQAQAKQPDLAAFWSSLTPPPTGSPAGTPTGAPTAPATASPGVSPAKPPRGASPAARPGRVLIDPATRSLAEADPACW